HLADADQVEALARGSVRKLDSRIDTELGLGARHCWSNGEVRRAAHHLAVKQFVSIAQIRIDAGVNDLDFDPAISAEHVDRRAAAEKVVDHLRGDFAWISADALARH